jgi:phosphopantothenoylcysteine decarboxylase
MAKVLLGVTGSVAAILTPAIYDVFKRHGHQLKVVATRPALYFFDPAELEPRDGKRNPDVVVLDEDEWPGRGSGRRWRRGDPVLHIELRRWADLLVIAPLDANTLAKLANGIADNCLTCVWRAWDPARPVVLAPAMNTLMWEHPLTVKHLFEIAATTGQGLEPPWHRMQVFKPEDAIMWMNQTCPTLRVVAPQSKRLACGDVGQGALAPVEDIVAAVRSLLSVENQLPPEIAEAPTQMFP